MLGGYPVIAPPDGCLNVRQCSAVAVSGHCEEHAVGARAAAAPGRIMLDPPRGEPTVCLLDQEWIALVDSGDGTLALISVLWTPLPKAQSTPGIQIIAQHATSRLRYRPGGRVVRDDTRILGRQGLAEDA